MLRSRKGSIAAEHTAVIIVMIMGMFFPLVNIATSGYRYALALQAVHNGAYIGSVAASWSAGSDPKGNAVMDTVPASINNYIAANTGVHNPNVKVRMLDTDINTGTVTPLGYGAKLPADPQAGHIYSVECTLECDIDPLVVLKSGFVPQVPGMTSSYHSSMTAKQLLENPGGMTK